MLNGKKLATIILSLIFSTGVLALDSDSMGMISNIYKMSSKVTQLGELAKGKLDNPKLKAFNDQMMTDHKSTLGTLGQVASQLGFDLPKSEPDPEIDKLKDQNTNQFQKSYLEQSIGMNSQLLETLKTKVVPAIQSPMLKTLLSGFAPKVSGLLEKAKALQSTLKK